MADVAVDEVEQGTGEEGDLAEEELETYQLIVKGNGITVERAISNDQLVTVLSIVLGGSRALAGAVAPATRTGSGREDSLSGSSRPGMALREYLNDVVPKSSPQKLVVAALYQRETLEKEATGRDEFKTLLQRAGEQIPKNLGRDISVAVRSGWLEEDHAEAGRYYVTRTGEDAVRNRFGGDNSKSQRAKRRPKKNGKPKVEPTE